MFKTKYTINFLNSQWEIIKKDAKVWVIPRIDEYIWLVDKYYIVTQVVHSLTDKKHLIYVVVEPK